MTTIFGSRTPARTAAPAPVGEGTWIFIVLALFTFINGLMFLSGSMGQEMPELAPWFTALGIGLLVLATNEGRKGQFIAVATMAAALLGAGTFYWWRSESRLADNHRFAAAMPGYVAMRVPQSRFAIPRSTLTGSPTMPAIGRAVIVDRTKRALDEAHFALRETVRADSPGTG